MTGRPSPMNAETAIQNIADMKRETSNRSQIAMLRLALGPMGNLSCEAAAIYRQRLAELE